MDSHTSTESNMLQNDKKTSLLRKPGFAGHAVGYCLRLKLLVCILLRKTLDLVKRKKVHVTVWADAPLPIYVVQGGVELNLQTLECVSDWISVFPVLFLDVYSVLC